ncbi:nuclear transport factor 2 family protein [Gordonia sp. CPCC 205515]|uniref:nuclear transport factor 2 family protein n=1 Tax=Gordonia sp. CPCC 205515 TaxID=3140791 RepID=UPI003AF3BE11
MSTFREAVEKHDMAAVDALLADDVIFRSPVAFKPYEGKAITSAILRNVVEVFEDFHYVREIGADGDANQVLVFEAKVGGLAVTGADFLLFDDEGKVAELMVMVRPLRAAEALAKEMGARFDNIVKMAAGTTTAG